MIRTTLGTSLLTVGLLGGLSHADTIEVDLGRFLFTGGTDAYVYEGDWAEAMGSDVEGSPDPKTVATVDLGMIADAVGAAGLAWIRIEDPGTNFYQPISPGSDIDLFTVVGLPDEAHATYSYEGPNPTCADWTHEDIADRVTRLDAQVNGGPTNPFWVSLGEQGALSMHFEGWPQSDGGDSDSGGADGPGDPGDGGGGDGGGGDGGSGDEPDVSIDLGTDEWQVPGQGGDGSGGPITLPSWSNLDLQLRFNEVSPTAEWTRVTIGFTEYREFTPVPGPAALGVLGLGLRIRRRRR